MFGSTVLEVGIGMALLFLFVGLICTAVREGAEATLKSRAKDLERGIREVLQDRQRTGITASSYNHPLIISLFSGDYDPSKLKADGRGDLYMPREDRAHLPSYIPALNFAGALLDMAARGRNSGEASATPADQPRDALVDPGCPHSPCRRSRCPVPVRTSALEEHMTRPPVCDLGCPVTEFWRRISLCVTTSSPSR